MNLNFSKFTVILVAVPLLFQLFFVVTLFGLLHSFEESKHSESQARELTTHVNSLLGVLVETCTAAILGSVSDDQQFEAIYRDSQDKERKDSADIRAMMPDLAPEDRNELRNVLKNAVEFGARVHKLRECMVSGETERAKAELAKEVPLEDSIRDSIKRIGWRQAAIEKAQRQRQNEELFGLFTFLAAGVIFNGLLVIGLLIAFDYGIMSRLRRIKDNTVKLAANQALSRPLSGSDEFARLDTAMRKMARALAIAQQKEHAVMENSPDVICSFDAKGRFTAVSPACEKVWGFSANDLLGSRWSQIAPPEDVSRILSEVKQTPDNLDLFDSDDDIVGASLSPSDRQSKSEIQDSYMRGFEMSVQSRGGQIVDTLWSGQWSAEKKSLFFVAHDIADIKRAERERNEFTRLLRDNLKTPLVNIQRIHELFETPGFVTISEPGRKRLLIASREIQRLIGLVNGLLDVHKLGKDLDLQIEQASLNAIVNSSLHAVGGFAERQSVKLESQTGEDIVLNVDRERLIQVLINLLSNAVKFSPNGGSVAVRIDAQPGMVTISVVDRGRGVPESMRQTIFERFKQVEKADAQQKGGTGLGLAICKAIVEQHGGTIGVDSEEGKGSSFWIRIPR